MTGRRKKRKVPPISRSGPRLFRLICLSFLSLSHIENKGKCVKSAFFRVFLCLVSSSFSFSLSFAASIRANTFLEVKRKTFFVFTAFWELALACMLGNARMPAHLPACPPARLPAPSCLTGLTRILPSTIHPGLQIELNDFLTIF